MTNLVLMFITGAIWWLLVPFVCYAFFTLVLWKPLKLTWRSESAGDTIVRILCGALMLLVLTFLLLMVFGAGHIVLDAMEQFYPTP